MQKSLILKRLKTNKKINYGSYFKSRALLLNCQKARTLNYDIHKFIEKQNQVNMLCTRYMMVLYFDKQQQVF